MNRNISFLNLKKLFLDHETEFTDTFRRIASEAHFIGGKELEAFERDFAAWVGDGFFCVGCGNGTDAVTLAAEALDLPKGSEAIIPAMTFVATAEGLLHAGFEIKLVDVSPDTWLMDPKALEKAITPKTKLIVPVHLYGQMAPMDEIRRIADSHGCKVMEDSAQSHGATWKGHPVGFYSDIATYSFFPGKNLGAFGDGGAMLSRNKELLMKASSIAKHGGLKKYEHIRVGYNSRLDTMQAAMLSIKLKHLSKWNDRRREVAAIYRRQLSAVKGLRLSTEQADAKSVYHLFVVTVEDRGAFQNFLKDRGVETGIHYPLPIHQLPAFAKHPMAAQSFPQAEYLAQHGISLPMCPTLTDSEVDYVCDQVKAFFQEKKARLPKETGPVSLNG